MTIFQPTNTMGTNHYMPDKDKNAMGYVGKLLSHTIALNKFLPPSLPGAQPWESWELRIQRAGGIDHASVVHPSTFEQPSRAPNNEIIEITPYFIRIFDVKFH